MRKVYVVTNYGGQWEDRWESIVAVYSSKEEAEKRVKKIYDAYNKPLAISEELYSDLVDQLDEYYEKNNIDETTEEVTALHKLFPQYSIKDLQEAHNHYYNYDDWVGSNIQEVDFYE